ncbi:DUF1273 domain-containing protein [Companilactobacillus sp.]|jgi:uncharacterized phage-like protein YoqJ|uniref:DUF1273 domain-containing protein n=1 Tax=Companilactobacillus sp. TaxID=2767905 RepID=UPI0025C3B0FC|nr:DUF1273 domain-containing protein [Companilactobacillus sp.]MCH4008249.1 DUF1273 domain-containing protein [Companilactobacillus sp.]MCH4051572.1 DUF1273 domain-containing protein [Companilactobacillus sp.]MCH4076192.1 DUF1273 domain-containing protein [Companilactobacillus sp.]MCH4124767.1 DUF1273 domain-containing protein [Companilactobacillus sp.]MCH4131309.1 DUF1273 domain-containing protein [Companilactobacillus sp.]
MIKNLWVTGYRSYELGVFKPDDPKVEVIKKFLYERLINYAEEGTEWVITGAQLGTEQYIGPVVQQVKDKGYNIKHAVMLPFANFGDQWNESNQSLLNIFLRNADYVNKITTLGYHSSIQLRTWQNFMLQHTDGSLIFYDPDSGGKPKYDYSAMKDYIDRGNDYSLELVDFDAMQDFANNLSEE